MRSGLLGGTFDPIHNGHLIVAEAVRSDFNLDRIFFIPAAVPPHKDSRELSPENHRLEMVHRAIMGNEHFKVSDFELKSCGISYTINTIKWFKQSSSYRNDQFFLIIGADSLLDFHTWKDPEEIFNTIKIIVMKRPGFDIDNVKSEFRNRVIVADVPMIEISSTNIRKRVREGKSIRYLVPEKVEEYIKMKRLYL